MLRMSIDGSLAQAACTALIGALMGACAPCPSQTRASAAAYQPAQPQSTLVGSSQTEGSGPSSFVPGARPKLVLVIAIDQFRADNLTRFDTYLSANGFKRLLRQGTSFTGHYGHYVTYTGPGHALLLSGSYPYVNGIAANKFFNQETQRSEAMVFDANAQILGLKNTDPDMDVSPRNFAGSTVGDELILSTGGQAKVITLATKGRGAILMGGRLGKSFFMNDETGEMTTSTYYMPKLPGWVAQWNGKKMADSYFGKTWDRMAPAQVYASSMPDNAPYEGGGKGLGKTFPHTVNGKLTAPGPDYYEAFQMTPFANEYELSFAQAAIEGENLGGRGVADLIGISLSATDLAGHDFGPFSQEVQDLILRTDKQIGDFLDWIYQKFGNNVLVVVTADHGATPVPEQMAAMGFDAARIKKKTIKDAVEGALKKKYGGEKWVAALEDPHIFLNRKQIEDKKLDAQEVERIAGEAAASIKGFGGFFTRTQLLKGEVPNTELGRSILRSYFAARGGDVVLWTLPYYFWGKYGEKDVGSTHGTYYRYDAEVPVFIAGASVRAGRLAEHEMIDIAPTISHLLGIAAPAASEGQVIALER